MPTSSMPWIKLHTETIDDPKMGRLSDRLWRRAMEIFLLAGKHGAGGYLPPIQDMAWILRTSEADLTLELAQLSEVDIVRLTDDGWFVVHFAERQDADSNAERQKRYRERKHHQDYGGEATKEQPETQESNEPITKENKERVTKSNNTHNEPLRRLREEEEEDKESRGKSVPEKGAKAPAAQSAATPPMRDELRIDTSEGGRTLQALLEKALTGTRKRPPVFYANCTQRDAYLQVYSRLNGSLADMIAKGIQREITERNKLLSWLQGCVKKAGLDEEYQKRQEAPLSPDEWAAQHLAGLGSDITDYVR